ncbi:alkaline phosphatase family protein [Okibacterium sp. HSC-33S16]|uniref:alkaline phosphatase family protein n=1 Tax=Okibacterium sp. HSC-33S16 TaxID=2910965 RepID=UPI0020A20B3A|nr:alkaline phosphatase family protein [Okibacterium sp. HSC-33S16]
MESRKREPENQSGASRRDFFRASGIAVSGLAVGGLTGAAVAAAADADPGYSPVAPRSEPGFDHLVVLMFENRSFDNLLGRLYENTTPPNGQSFRGIAEGHHSNTAPDGTVVPSHVFDGPTDTVMSQPAPDPGETYPHVNTQLFGIVDPPDNSHLTERGAAKPFNAPPDGATPTMSGFVTDYIINYRHEQGGKEPSVEEYGVAMGGFSPDMLPVMSTLARNFAVYDAWHCAVPSQTFCNRSFFHAGTSHGFVTNVENGGIGKWLDPAFTTTLFTQLEEAGISWRVYYDDDQLISLTGLIHAAATERYWKSNFRGMKQFHDDVARGTLPTYAFIEPRMIFNHNDMHPPVGRLRESTVDGKPVTDSALSDVRAGEVLLSSVYTAIKESASTTGSNALNTTLVITFDEHGGTYDHVPPPAATPPDEEPKPGEMGFTFDRLGVRVPAIVVSAYTPVGAILSDEMHHGAIAATLGELFTLTPLSRRNEGARTIRNALTLTKPRQPALWPDTHPAYVPPNSEAQGAVHESDAHHPLTSPAKGVLGLLLAKYEPSRPVPETYADAYEVLVKHGTGLFGVTE